MRGRWHTDDGPGRTFDERGSDMSDDTINDPYDEAPVHVLDDEAEPDAEADGGSDADADADADSDDVVTDTGTDDDDAGSVGVS